LFCPNDARELCGKEYTVNEVLTEILKDKEYYGSTGGATFSGGECMLQIDFLEEILRSCKQHNIHTAIETSGFAAESTIRKVLKYCDLVLFDIKETDNERHLEYTGTSLNNILRNLKVVNDMKVPFVIRLPIIPGINNREDHLQLYCLHHKYRHRSDRFCQELLSGSSPPVRHRQKRPGMLVFLSA
jgi:pyruvate formate lyase activating enzyme